MRGSLGPKPQQVSLHLRPGAAGRQEQRTAGAVRCNSPARKAGCAQPVCLLLITFIFKWGRLLKMSQKKSFIVMEAEERPLRVSVRHGVNPGHGEPGLQQPGCTPPGAVLVRGPLSQCLDRAKAQGGAGPLGRRPAEHRRGSSLVEGNAFRPDGHMEGGSISSNVTDARGRQNS